MIYTSCNSKLKTCNFFISIKKLINCLGWLQKFGEKNFNRYKNRWGIYLEGPKKVWALEDFPKLKNYVTVMPKPLCWEVQIYMYFTEPFDQNMFCIGFKHIMDIIWGVSFWKPTNPLVQFQGGVTYAEMLGRMHYS